MWLLIIQTPTTLMCFAGILPQAIARGESEVGNIVSHEESVYILLIGLGKTGQKKPRGTNRLLLLFLKNDTAIYTIHHWISPTNTSCESKVHIRTIS